MTEPASHRRATLRAEVVLAIADLDQVRSNDPAAARAMHAVRLATITLEDFWMPVLDDAGVTD